ncbi:MAG: hypothetical protein M0D57_07080 [Sphingobacteriales bacterium JAD_PAG50586_3]|nr:MAG: hypothetical protein M0D57_07080 [Sphingobacteriales bacterium JAD_PAG50586_3]
MKTKHFAFFAALVAVIALVALVAPGSQLANPAENSSASIKNTTQHTTTVDLPQSVRDLVTKELVTPLRKKHYGSDKPSGREFSRCPSGIHASFEDYDVAAKDGYFHGVINKWAGCDNDELCEFRANATGVQVKTKNSGYVNAAEWLNRAIAKQGVKEI